MVSRDVAKRLASERELSEEMIEQEFQKRIDSEIQKRVDEALSSAEIQSEIKRRIAEGRANLMERVQEQLDQVFHKIVN